MQAIFSRSFKKKYKKLKVGERAKTRERLLMFEENSSDPLLNNHALKGKYEGYYSINITGDLRALYEPIRKDLVLFVKIDTHSNLYS